MKILCLRVSHVGDLTQDKFKSDVSSDIIVLHEPDVASLLAGTQMWIDQS